MVVPYTFLPKYFSKFPLKQFFFGRKNFRPNVASTTVDAKVFFFLKCCSGGVWVGEAPPGISVTRALRVRISYAYEIRWGEIDFFRLQNLVPFEMSIQIRCLSAV